MTAEDSDDDMEDVEEGIPMQGEDGQHYVVLEVRLPGSDTILWRSDQRRIEHKINNTHCMIWKLFHIQVIQLPEQSGDQGVVQIGPGPSGLQPPTTRFLSDIALKNVLVQ